MIKTILQKMIWRALVVIVAAIAYVVLAHPDWVVQPPVVNLVTATDDKCYSSCTDPNRPYYDMWGNEFDYMGNLIKAAPCTVDPISKKPNPYSCTTQNTTVPATVNTQPAPTPAPVSSCESLK